MNKSEYPTLLDRVERATKLMQTINYVDNVINGMEKALVYKPTTDDRHNAKISFNYLIPYDTENCGKGVAWQSFDSEQIYRLLRLDDRECRGMMFDLFAPCIIQRLREWKAGLEIELSKV